mmetsp:Transcript_18172/g.59374  ORF Transcript_18172/g.59374 Transcript_18172/m.59374 type:complete len:244 (-) Transcript_18172:1138-1869(-)
MAPATRQRSSIRSSGEAVADSNMTAAMCAWLWARFQRPSTRAPNARSSATSAQSSSAVATPTDAMLVILFFHEGWLMTESAAASVVGAARVAWTASSAFAVSVHFSRSSPAGSIGAAAARARARSRALAVPPARRSSCTCRTTASRAPSVSLPCTTPMSAVAWSARKHSSLRSSSNPSVSSISGIACRKSSLSAKSTPSVSARSCSVALSIFFLPPPKQQPKHETASESLAVASPVESMYLSR